MSTVDRLKSFARTGAFAAGVVALAGCSTEPVEKFALERVARSELGYTHAKVVGDRVAVRMDDDQCSPVFDHKYEMLGRTTDGRVVTLVACVDDFDGPVFTEVDPETRLPRTLRVDGDVFRGAARAAEGGAGLPLQYPAAQDVTVPDPETEQPAPGPSPADIRALYGI